MSGTTHPPGWQVTTLDRLQASVEYALVGGPFGSDLTSADYQDEPGVPVIRGTNLGGETCQFVDEGFVYVSDQKAHELRRNTASPGDIVFTQRGTLGQVAVVPTRSRFKKYVISQSQMKLTPDLSKVDSQFLYQYFRSPQLLARITRQTLATGVPHINLGILKALPVPLPPLPEQRRIAEILDRAEALRAKRRAAIAQLDELTQAIFVDMFGDPATANTELHRVRLCEITTKITDGTHLTPKFRPSGVPFIFVKNVRNGRIDFTTDKFISEEQHEELYRRCPVDQGDILYTIVGATYGFAALVSSFTKFAFQRHLAHLKPDRSKVLPDFLGTVMQLPFVKHQADRWARGVAQPTVNLTELRDFEVPLPLISQQRDFVNRQSGVDKLKSAHRTSLAELDALFATLQNLAFRGEV